MCTFRAPCLLCMCRTRGPHSVLTGTPPPVFCSFCCHPHYISPHPLLFWHGRQRAVPSGLSFNSQALWVSTHRHGNVPLSSPFKANNVHGMAVRYTSLEACRCLHNHTSTLPAGRLHAWGHTLYMHGDCMHGNCMHGDCLCGNGDCVHGDWQLGTLMIHQRVTGEGMTGEE